MNQVITSALAGGRLELEYLAQYFRVNLRDIQDY
jgi:hypothetical protein